MESLISHVLYAALFAVAVTSAVLVISLRNTIYCALSLVVTMLCLAGIFLLIQAPFVALIQVLVYAGAIMVLFLYVIMLLNPRRMEPITEIVIARRGLAFLLVSVFFLLITAWIFRISPEIAMDFQFETVGIRTLATHLLTDYLLPFELTSVLLLVAIVGAILIAKRN